jgi:tRNA(Ile)-lysidine synthase TilS/MesJ
VTNQTVKNRGDLPNLEISACPGPADKTNTLSERTLAAEAFRRKLDLFMRVHVLPDFHPARIQWWLSLSGGKDSYAMAAGLREWYQIHALPFHAKIFSIDQWGGPAAHSLRQQIDWATVSVINGRSLTTAKTSYQPGDQAPCRACADVRRSLTDELLGTDGAASSDFVNFVARGLHLSDVAVSAAWRFVMARDVVQDMVSNNKAAPIAPITTDGFLVKPLSYVREFESQAFATQHGFVPLCCGCPACHHPSRRDIAEETVIHAFRGPFWEFDVPGVTELLELRARAEVVAQAKAFSAPGLEVKHRHLPEEFFEFSVEYYRSIVRKSTRKDVNFFDSSHCLDEIGLRQLRYPSPPIKCSSTLPAPALFSLADSEVMKYRHMIAALGPFWGAFALDYESYLRALAHHEQLFGFSVDERWSHVISVLNEFYRSKHAIKQASKKLAVYNLPVLDNCICGT